MFFNYFNLAYLMFMLLALCLGWLAKMRIDRAKLRFSATLIPLN